jgi:hypothetical protein
VITRESGRPVRGPRRHRAAPEARRGPVRA